MRAYRRDPGHGTRSTYTAGCRCDQCRTANREYIRKWLHDGGDLVDAGPAKKKALELRARGFSLRRIADGSGVSDGTVRRLVAGVTVRVQRSVEAALLAWDGEDA